MGNNTIRILQHQLFYFTGTGNGLSVAKRLKDSFEEKVELCRITYQLFEKESSENPDPEAANSEAADPKAADLKVTDSEAADPESKIKTESLMGIDKKSSDLTKEGRNDFTEIKRFGLVCPVFFGTIPNMVKRFLERIEIEPGTYIYILLTHGGMPGNAEKCVEEILLKRGIPVQAFFDIRMPYSGILLKETESQDRICLWMGALDAKILEVSEAVKKGDYRSAFQTKPDFALQYAMGLLSGPNFHPGQCGYGKQFYHNDQCLKCGKCRLVCPAGNIKMSDEGPIWDDHCENCMGCIQFCPRHAICFPGKEQISERYMNPEINIRELYIGKIKI